MMVIVSTENKKFDEAINAQSNANISDSITLITLLDITATFITNEAS